MVKDGTSTLFSSTDSESKADSGPAIHSSHTVDRMIEVGEKLDEIYPDGTLRLGISGNGHSAIGSGIDTMVGAGFIIDSRFNGGLYLTSGIGEGMGTPDFSGQVEVGFSNASLESYKGGASYINSSAAYGYAVSVTSSEWTSNNKNYKEFTIGGGMGYGVSENMVHHILIYILYGSYT